MREGGRGRKEQEKEGSDGAREGGREWELVANLMKTCFSFCRTSFLVSMYCDCDQEPNPAGRPETSICFLEFFH